MGACLHQILNLRNENLLWTPERWCTWSAKRIWIPLYWKLWRRREVLRRSYLPMVKCRRMKRQQCMSQNWTYSWLWKSSKTRQQSFLSESFAMNTDIRVDQRSKTTSYQKRYSDTVQHGELRSDRGSWFINEFFLKLALFNVPTSSSSSSTSPTMTSSTVSNKSVVRQKRWDLDSYPAAVSSKHVERQERRDPCSSGISEELLTKPTKNPKPNKNEDHDQERWDLCHSDVPEWLQEFRESLVDGRVPEHRDSHASSSHEPSLEPTPARSADLGKHSVYTHFPKDRNCEICQRTKITRAPCRRGTGRVVLRAENCGDLITADHKVLSEKLWISKQSSICSRGAGLGHPMDPAVSVQNKNFSANTKELAKVLGAE